MFSYDDDEGDEDNGMVGDLFEDEIIGGSNGSNQAVDR
jgi:hypothetical protein